MLGYLVRRLLWVVLILFAISRARRWCGWGMACMSTSGCRLRSSWPGTLHAQGMILRRDKQKTAAKAALQQALDLFDPLGAHLWAQRASAKLARVGLRSATPSGMTQAEARVAELAATGQTNRQVADALFMSPKTVEAHLSRIYRKLEVRSRTELATRLAHDTEPA